MFDFRKVHRESAIINAQTLKPQPLVFGSTTICVTGGQC